MEQWSEISKCSYSCTSDFLVISLGFFIQMTKHILSAYLGAPNSLPFIYQVIFICGNFVRKTYISSYFIGWLQSIEIIL